MRQLVLLCDGTNNNLTGAAQDTHVVALAELLRADPDDERVVFYDPGVGNPGELPGTTVWDKARRQAERIDGLAFGRGVFDNIAEGYRFLMHQWRSDQDEIWLFGFSRGAFTARSIAGLINRFGILQPQMASMVPTLLHLYFSDATPKGDAIGTQASRLFAMAPQRKPFVQFVGVWDTVATVGTWPFSLRIKAKPTLQGKRFVHVRQALALDEHRAQFVPRAYAENNGPIQLADGQAGSISQQWFRGAHCDVGGGYALTEGRLARAPLTWLVCEAVQCGLRLRHGGQLLNSEASAAAAVAQVIQQITGKPDPVTTGAAHPTVHCQLHITPLWALSGMALRDTRRVAVDDAPDVPAHMG
ncbi:MAG: T6SS phospholipase effector Tle1-like catalytic domain-containing protein, partial [Burkholderiales bacterium]